MPGAGFLERLTCTTTEGWALKGPDEASKTWAPAESGKPAPFQGTREREKGYCRLWLPAPSSCFQELLLIAASLG